MIIKPCPNCGRLPKIKEGCRRKNGNHFYMIGCPNLCSVLKTRDKWTGCPAAWLSLEGDYDYNMIYKKWNEEIESE